MGDEFEVAVGVDGGASRLKWSLRLPGGTFHHGRATGVNPKLVGWDPFLETLGQTLREALESAGSAPDRVGSVGLGMAGVDRPTEKERLGEWARRTFPNLRRRWIGNDALAALRVGAGALAGVVLVAGTGSICVGVGPDGRQVRVGGWGSALGDEGAGFWIGRRLLQAACGMADGRIDATDLLPRLLARLGLDGPEALIPWAAGLGETATRQVAGLAPLALELAGQGDPVCREIRDRALQHLAAHARVAAERIGPAASDKGTKLVCAGGLFENHPPFFGRFAELIRECAPSLEPVRLSQPASLGALWLGVEAPELPR